MNVYADKDLILAFADRFGLDVEQERVFIYHDEGRVICTAITLFLNENEKLAEFYIDNDGKFLKIKTDYIIKMKDHDFFKQ